MLSVFSLVCTVFTFSSLVFSLQWVSAVSTCFLSSCYLVFIAPSSALSCVPLLHVFWYFLCFLEVHFRKFWIASNKALIFVRLLNFEFCFGVWNMSPTQCYRIQGHQQEIRQHGKLFKNGGSRQKAKKQSREAKHQENNIRITGRLDYKEYKKIWQAGSARQEVHTPERVTDC